MIRPIRASNWHARCSRQPRPATRASFVETAERVCRQGLDGKGRSIIVRRPERGTVSSTILALTLDPHRAIYRFAPYAPDRATYDDYSVVLRGLLRRGE